MDPLAYQFLENLNAAVKRKVTVTLIGGNALCALGLKDRTRDVDLVVRSTQREVAAFCREYLQRYKVKVDFFVDGLFHSVRVADYLQKAFSVNAPEFPNLEVKILNIYDVILTKTLRFIERDQVDIKNVVSQMPISASELDNRANYYLKHFLGPKDDFIQNYNLLKRAFGHLFKP